MSLAMSIRAKGLGGFAARAGVIASRFGFDEGRMRRSLDRYLEITGTAGIRPSLPVTAVVLDRHPRLIREYAARGVEFPVHGLVHADHASLDSPRQERDLTRAVALFRAAGLAPVGFRGPYLRFSPTTDAVLRMLGFTYHSSQAIHYAVLSEELRNTDSYRRALSFYRAWNSEDTVARPRIVNGLLHIPVTVPDDEMFVERLGLSSAAQVAAWRHILEATYRDEELFTVQLHPERIADVGESLATVLSDARALGDVWIAQLHQIAEWWRGRATARIDVRQTTPGSFDVVLHGTGPLAMVIDRPRGDPQIVGPAQRVEIRSEVPPEVGVRSSADDSLLSFLRDEGYVVRLGPDERTTAAFCDPREGWTEKQVLDELRRASAPLVRIARWPMGSRSALAVSGDIDSITYQDFALRLWETR